jgi:hypothetical protein
MTQFASLMQNNLTILAEIMRDTSNLETAAPASSQGNGLVSLRVASDLLAEAGDPVEASSLSRYVAKYADALMPQKKGRELLVDITVLAQHRRENVRMPTRELPVVGTRTRVDEAAGNLRAQRQLRELELAERTGALTRKSDVEEAAVDALTMLKNAFALAIGRPIGSLTSASLWIAFILIIRPAASR